MPGKKKPKKAKSKTQQRLMGMVYAYKEGNLKLKGLDPELAKKIRKIAKNLKLEDAEKMASTKHKKLPEKIKETHIKRFSDLLNEDIEVKSTGDFIDDVVDLELDALRGGQAEGKTLQDVADKHNIPVEYLEFILPDAIQIEVEHTDDPKVATRIALDHLWETPLYYDEKLGLPEMEEELDEMEKEEVDDVINDRLSKKVKKFDEMEDE